KDNAVTVTVAATNVTSIAYTPSGTGAVMLQITCYDGLTWEAQYNINFWFQIRRNGVPVITMPMRVVSVYNDGESWYSSYFAQADGAYTYLDKAPGTTQSTYTTHMCTNGQNTSAPAVSSTNWKPATCMSMIIMEVKK